MNTQKVFIIGAGGHVGASAAYAMALRHAAYEIVLIGGARYSPKYGHYGCSCLWR